MNTIKIPSKEYDFDPHNLPDELLKAIGLAIACGAQTEAVISMGIGGCLGLDIEYAAATTTHMTLPLKFSIFRSAAEINIDDLDDLDELDRLLDAVDKALGKRHEIAHATWCRDPDSNELFRVKQVARTRLESDKIHANPKQVRADAEVIYTAGMDLMKFIGERGLVPRLPTTLRPRGHKSKAARKKRGK
jgi:hypothetical protein